MKKRQALFSFPRVSYKARQSAACFGAVLLLHAAALYAVIHESNVVPPVISVPLSVSFATAPTPVKRKAETPKPIPTPAISHVAIAEPEPERPSAKDEPEPPQVTAARHDAAYLNNPEPAYPSLSRRLGEQGRVWLRVFVNPDGSAREVQVRTSSGHVRLDRAAKQAAERWKFVPARNGSVAVGAWVEFTINFTLS
ncbi:MAG TPA: TonB family protein [Burkholderiales bacterium]|nr:TonB family protein [Burkholderiales bacterium]